MSPPARSEIPRWPKTSAELHPDGTGTLTIAGRQEPINEATITQARAVVIRRIARFAAEDLQRPVRPTHHRARSDIRRDESVPSRENPSDI